MVKISKHFPKYKVKMKYWEPWLTNDFSTICFHRSIPDYKGLTTYWLSVIYIYNNLFVKHEGLEKQHAVSLFFTLVIDVLNTWYVCRDHRCNTHVSITLPKYACWRRGPECSICFIFRHIQYVQYVLV